MQSCGSRGPFLLVFLSFFSCTLVENLQSTVHSVLSFVFSVLRQLIKTSCFLHNYFFFSTLIESSSLQKGIRFNRRLGVYPDISGLGRSDHRKHKYYRQLIVFPIHYHFINRNSLSS